MTQSSPLTKGVPFFVFMAAGTFVLSLFVQQRNDYADRHKRTVTGGNESAYAPTLKQELQELKQKAGAEKEYDMVRVPVRRG
eukprot:jgi/Ulvmu1/7668/UM038_0097.1